MERTMSGFPTTQWSSKLGCRGRSLGLPSAAPWSTHAATVSISTWLSLRSFEKEPKCGSALQGGISCVTTLSLIERAQGLASLYVSRDIGANSQGLWHSAQFLKIIGATSLSKVIALPCLPLVPPRPVAPSSTNPHSPAETISTIRRFTAILLRVIPLYLRRLPAV